MNATIIPWREQHINPCFGYRDATNLDSPKAVPGFPGDLLAEIYQSVNFINQKVIATSRGQKDFYYPGRPNN